jgi:hypothetical protein
MTQNQPVIVTQIMKIALQRRVKQKILTVF